MQARLFGLKGFFKLRSAGAAGVCLAMLVGCGGGGGGGTQSTPSAPPVSTVLPASSTIAAICAAPRPPGAIDPFTGQPYGDKVGTLNDEKSWVRSWIDETYLWYKEVPALAAASYPTPVGYFNALKTPAITSSGKPKDQFHFVFDTAQWAALSQSGVEIGYGFEVALLVAAPPRKALIAYTDPRTPAAGAGIARGAEILTVDGIDLVNDGTQAGVNTLNNGLFPTAAGTHTFTIKAITGAVSSTSRANWLS